MGPKADLPISLLWLSAYEAIVFYFDLIIVSLRLSYCLSQITWWRPAFLRPVSSCAKGRILQHYCLWCFIRIAYKRYVTWSIEPKAIKEIADVKFDARCNSCTHTLAYIILLVRVYVCLQALCTILLYGLIQLSYTYIEANSLQWTVQSCRVPWLECLWYSYIFFSLSLIISRMCFCWKFSYCLWSIKLYIAKLSIIGGQLDGLTKSALTLTMSQTCIVMIWIVVWNTDTDFPIFWDTVTLNWKVVCASWESTDVTMAKNCTILIILKNKHRSAPVQSQILSARPNA